MSAVETLVIVAVALPLFVVVVLAIVGFRVDGAASSPWDAYQSGLEWVRDRLGRSENRS